MNETFSLVMALLAGVLLGTIFFGGLWWTIQKGKDSKRPELLFLSSLLLRISITLAGFYFFGHGYWKRMMVCLIGFVIARFFVMWLNRKPSKKNRTRLKQEARHAT